MKPEALARSFGATVLQKHLSALKQEMDGVRQAEDIEAIHRMRVASRRLRAAIPLFTGFLGKKRSETWLERIKGITRALGEARDADVQIELLRHILTEAEERRVQPGLNRLVLRLTQRRAKFQKAILNSLDALESSGFLLRMETNLASLRIDSPEIQPFPHLLYELSARANQECLEDFLSYEQYINRPECATELHAMRIAAKKLRYTLETFASLYPDGLASYIQAVRNAQENLGNLHDCDVWLASLPQFIKDERQRTLQYYGHTRPLMPLLPGLNFFLKNRQNVREQEYEEFRQRWQKWTAEDIWGKLTASLKTPIYPDIYPTALVYPAN